VNLSTAVQSFTNQLNSPHSMCIIQIENMAATRAEHPCYHITFPLPATESLCAGKWAVTFWVRHQTE